MYRVAVFVDGFNLYHALNDVTAYHKYKWLNLEKFSKCFIEPKDTIVDVFYFTAYAAWDPLKLARHKIYVSALRLVNVKIVFGAFRHVDQKCKICKKIYQTYREKRTDVNIAIKLFQTAIDDTWDKALIISGDSDLIPAIEGIKKTFPTKKIGIAIPIGRRAEELKQVTDFHRKVKPKHLTTCQFDDIITIDANTSLQRPTSWR